MFSESDFELTVLQVSLLPLLPAESAMATLLPLLPAEPRDPQLGVPAASAQRALQQLHNLPFRPTVFAAVVAAVPRQAISLMVRRAVAVPTELLPGQTPLGGP